MAEIESIRDLVRSGVRYLADLVSQIVDRIAGVVPVVLAIGCEGPEVERKPPPAAVVQPAPKVVEKVDDEPKPIGKFDITFYYVAGEAESAKPANTTSVQARGRTETSLATIAPAELVSIYEPTNCGVIAEVSPTFAAQLQMQGTGKLRDGRVVNIWGGCSCERKPCFKVTENQWGTGGSGKPLHPFRTVAVDRRLIKLGSLLYVPLLEGRTMPGRAPWGGYVHDGCVVADDTGGGIKGHQLDLFVGRKGWFLGLSGSRGNHAWARHVPVFDGSKLCERKGRRVGRKAAAS